MATLVQGHAVRHDVGALEGLSRLRLPRGLGVVLRAHSATRRDYLRGARAAELAAPVQQRAGAVGRADGARRLPEHPGAASRPAGACTNRAARSSTPSRRAASCKLAAAAGRDVRVRRREDRGAAGLRRSAVRARPARAEARAASRRARASTCRIAITSAPRSCRMRRCSRRCSRASTSCSPSYAGRAGGRRQPRRARASRASSSALYDVR